MECLESAMDIDGTGCTHPRWDDRTISRRAAKRARDIGDILKDCAQFGQMEALRAALGTERRSNEDSLHAVRELVYELAGASNRDLAVDVLIHATGLAEFAESTLRDYARKHGLSHEAFRQQVIAMRQRLNLPRRAASRYDAN